MSLGQQIGERDFSKKIIKALRKKGIIIYGIQFSPDCSGSYLNGERLYLISHDDCSYVRKIGRAHV